MDLQVTNITVYSMHCINSIQIYRQYVHVIVLQVNRLVLCEEDCTLLLT